MPIQVADYVFPTSRFRMVAADSHEFVADFDVQTFPQPDGTLCPVVGTSSGDGKWLRSVYTIYGSHIWAEREVGGDGSVEEYRSLGGRGTVSLPSSIQDGQRWSFWQSGQVTYTSPRGSVEHGTFVYKNAVWATEEIDDRPPDAAGLIPMRYLLYWLEQYTENYGAGDVVYERLHIFERGVGMVAYLDMQWPGGPKWVVRQ